jgi:hypothetical protein
MRRSIIYQVSDTEFVDLVRRSTGYSSILRRFGLSNKGSNWKTVKRRMDLLNLTVDDFLPKVASKPFVQLYENSEVFCKDSLYSRTKLRKRVLRDSLLEYVCSICGIGPIWNEQNLSLQLDHINGDSCDHRLENLRFLCPNCHSQTRTFSTRQIRVERLCSTCGDHITRYSKSGLCRRCSHMEVSPSLA